MKMSDFEATLTRRVLLINGVTPVRRLDKVSAATGREVYVKQDDQTSDVYGGTKTRKLEFILQEAHDLGARSLVTMGSWASHHVLATALHARPLCLDVHAVVSPQPRLPHVGYALHRCIEAGATLYPSNSGMSSAYAIWKLLRKLRRTGAQPYMVNLGGSSGAGMLGSVRGALELAQQVAENQAPRTGPIYVALGSGSTAAGIALGLVLAGTPRPVRAVQVTSKWVVNRFVINQLLHAGARLLVEPHLRRSLVKAASARILIDQSTLGDGYGWPCEKSDHAIALAGADGLALEATYTAKVIAALLGKTQETEPALYWHTLAAPSLPPAGELTLPSWFGGTESS